MSDAEDDSLPTTGTGTEQEVDAKEAAKARRLANLRPPFQKGQSGNPTGKNGRDKANQIAAFLEKPESNESDQTRFEAIVSRMCLAALYGDTSAAKLLLEYALGRPRATPSALDIAEHFRRVELDCVDITFRILGSTVQSMEPAKLKEVFQACARDARGFLAAAVEFTNGEHVEGLMGAHAEAKPNEETKQPETEQAEYPGDGETPRGEP